MFQYREAANFPSRSQAAARRMRSASARAEPDAAFDRGTGVARGTLSDLDGPFGACEQTLLFERRQPAIQRRVNP